MLEFECVCACKKAVTIVTTLMWPTHNDNKLIASIAYHFMSLPSGSRGVNNGFQYFNLEMGRFPICELPIPLLNCDINMLSR